MIGAGVVACLLAWLAYSLLVPPFGEAPLVARPAIAELPDGENAWIVCREAIRHLPVDRPTWVRKAEALRVVSARQRQELELAREAVDLVIRASGRPGWQTTTEPGTLLTDAGSPGEVRQAVSFAVAHVRWIELSGRHDEAVRLKASLYRMASATAEAHQGWLPVLYAAGMRRLLAEQLMLSAQEGKASVATLIGAAQALGEADAAFPTPIQAHDWDRDYYNRSWEDVCIHLAPISAGDAEPVTWQAYPLAARQRVFRGIVHERLAASAEARPAFERWDFRALAVAEATIRSRLATRWKRLDRPFLGEIVGARLVAIAFPGDLTGLMATLYRDRASSAAARAMLVLGAYRQQHGAYPAVLGEAFRVAGISSPSDPITGRPPGYRTEGHGVVLWLPGADGRDDGALLEPEAKGPVVQDGTDLVFTLSGRAG